MFPSYLEHIGSLINNGMRQGSRYGLTREALGITLREWAGTYPTRPGLNSKIGILEGLFLVGEAYSQEAVEAVAPKADLSLFTHRGAYGPRVAGQMEDLVRGIERDPVSRQHTLFIAGRGDTYTSDMPCTVALSFFVRQGHMDCVAMMRSSDVLKGLPTDFLQFGILTQVLAHCFDYHPRYVHIMAASSHVYLDDVGEKAPLEKTSGTYRVQPMFSGTALTRYREYRDWAVHAVKAAPWDGKLPRGIVRE